MKLKSVFMPGALLLLVITAACEKKSPTAPTTAASAGTSLGETSAADRPITIADTGVTIGAGTPVSPAANKQFRFNEQPVTLTISNGVTTGSTPLTYTFEVATDSGFGAKVFTKDVAQGASQTSVTVDRLAASKTYFWRARSNAGTVAGPYSASRSFEIGPEVVLQTPSLSAPANNSTVTGNNVALTANNVSRTGPAGQILYKFELSDSSSFGRIVSTATIAEQSGGQTTWAVPPAAVGTAGNYFWRVQASDPANGVTTANSQASAFQYVQFSLKNAIILDSPDDFRSWPETAFITEVDFTPFGIHVEFTKKNGPDRWPDIFPPGFAGPIQYCLGMAWNIGGQWYTSAPIEMWNDRDFGGGPPDEFALNWFYNPARWAPMTFSQPNPGDTIGFFVVAGDTRGFNSNQKYQERSNVILIPMPDGGGASHRFNQASPAGATTVSLRSNRLRSR